MSLTRPQSAAQAESDSDKVNATANQDAPAGVSSVITHSMLLCLALWTLTV